ncbi:hypothetical protein [Nonomuraea candida]|uniref:hypothetical protein n=1 Tax=Nonomuraea candida TaxID=359159 RepID=UPI0012FC70E2|nr:hypothetical protein [Nonomuraea candida]
MDVSVPPPAITEDSLARWLQAYVDNARGHPCVGRAVASWEDNTRHTTARLDLVHTQPGLPTEVRGTLVRLAVHMVAENGALRVVTAIDIPELQELGFRPAIEGAQVRHHRHRATVGPRCRRLARPGRVGTS